MTTDARTELSRSARAARNVVANSAGMSPSGSTPAPKTMTDAVSSAMPRHGTAPCGTSAEAAPSRRQRTTPTPMMANPSSASEPPRTNGT